MAPVPVIDSHIRLHPSEQSTISAFHDATGSLAHLEGFVLVGVNEKNDDPKYVQALPALDP